MYHTRIFDDIKKQGGRYIRLKPKKHFETTIVMMFAVIALCDNPINTNVLSLHPDIH